MMKIETNVKVEKTPEDILTWLIFVLDRSGSMAKIKADMVGGYNQFIAEQKKVKGKCVAFLYQFDDVYEAVYEDQDIQVVKDLTDETYVPRGWTALLDAVGKTINVINERIAKLPEDKRPDKVLVMTVTDGEENSSKEFQGDKIKEMINHQREKWKWEFAYIGANQDSWKIGSSMGLSAGTTCNYVASAAGVKGMFNALHESTTRYRSLSSADFKFDKDTADEDDKDAVKATT
jgi:uncharacterized protein YegL